MIKELTPDIINLRNNLVDLSDDKKVIDELSNKVTLMIISFVTGYLGTNYTKDTNTSKIKDEVVLKLTDMVVSELDLSCYKTNEVIEILDRTYKTMSISINVYLMENKIF